MHDKKKQSLHSDLIDNSQSRYCADADFDFDSIYLNSYRGLCAYACRYVDIATAEEIVQDTMMWLWDNRQTIIPGKSVDSAISVSMASGVPNCHTEHCCIFKILRK